MGHARMPPAGANLPAAVLAATLLQEAFFSGREAPLAAVHQL